MKKTKLSVVSLPALFLTLALASCGDDDNPGPGQGDCLADKITLTQTKVDNFASQHAVQITFDAKNTGSSNYDVTTGTARHIWAEIKVTTTDNTVYTEEQPLILNQLNAGATASVTQTADYGEGKTYKSYTIRLYCK
jgi:hypothetical protein